MFPLLPFAAGLLAGGLAVRYLRDEKTRASLASARDALTSAAHSGLSSLKSTAGDLRERLAPTTASEPAKKKPAGRKRGATAAKAAPKKAATATRKTAAAKPPAAPKRVPRKPHKSAAGTAV